MFIELCGEAMEGVDPHPIPPAVFDAPPPGDEAANTLRLRLAGMDATAYTRMVRSGGRTATRS